MEDSVRNRKMICCALGLVLIITFRPGRASLRRNRYISLAQSERIVYGEKSIKINNQYCWHWYKPNEFNLWALLEIYSDGKLVYSGISDDNGQLVLLFYPSSSGLGNHTVDVRYAGAIINKVTFADVSASTLIAFEEIFDNMLNGWIVRFIKAVA